MSRAVDLGPVDAAAIRTSGGKVRLRLLLTVEQLESMLLAARMNDPPDETHMERNETQCNAREEQNRIEDDEDDAQAPERVRESVSEAATRLTSPMAPAGRIPQAFVIKGTRAWDAWVAQGHDPSLSVRREVKGQIRSGWHFPSLFPPKQFQDQPTE